MPGYPTPRIYDFVIYDPIGGYYAGVEVKTTLFDTIFFNPFQVEKDVAMMESGGGFAPSIQRDITRVAYETYCVRCSYLNLRTAYLLERLTAAKIGIVHNSWPGEQEPF